MIIEQTHSVQTNLHGSVEFSVSDDSAKIFSFLSNFLYKEKERSVMTELCSNALDAHLMVGKENEPILVHLPTDLQRAFSVRDYGPGLSETQVYQFLTKYGSSSKGQSNDFIGGFGIGSKSPAAVSDTWTITSFHGGLETHYLIHINDKGIPSINKLYSKETTETGLLVAVPTKTIREWHNAAQEVFKYYNVLPTIKGTSSKIDKKTFEFNFNDLYYTEGNRARYYGSSLTAVMNRRGYEISQNQIRSDKVTFSCDVFLPFSTSSLSVSLSREDLQYDTATKAGMQKRFDEIWIALLAEWKKSVSGSNGIFDYQLNASTFKEKHFIDAETCKRIAIESKDVYAKKVNFNYLNNFNVVVPSLSDEGHFPQLVNVEKAKFLKRGRYGIGINSFSWDIDRQTKEQSINFNAKTKDACMFVLRDEKNSGARIRHAIETNAISVKEVLLVDASWYKEIPNEFQKIKASSLAKPPVTARVKSAKIASELWVQSGRTFVRQMESAINKTADVVCIKMTNATTTQSMADGHYQFNEKFRSSVQIIFVKSDKDIPSFAMTPEAWATKEFDRLVKNIDSMTMATKKRIVAGISSSGYGLIGVLTHVIKQKKYNEIPVGLENTVYGKKCALIKEIIESKVDLTSNDSYDMLLKIAKFLGKAVSCDMNEFTLENMFLDELKARYPMTKYVQGYQCKEVFDDVVNYVISIEKGV